MGGPKSTDGLPMNEYPFLHRRDVAQPRTTVIMGRRPSVNRSWLGPATSIPDLCPDTQSALFLVKAVSRIRQRRGRRELSLPVDWDSGLLGRRVDLAEAYWGFTRTKVE